MRTSNSEEGVQRGWLPRPEWERQRARAMARWSDSVGGMRRIAREHARRAAGLPLPFSEWERRRRAAIDAWRSSGERRRRAEGDRALIEAIDSRLRSRTPIACAATARGTAVLPCTMQAASVAKAVIGIASATGVLYSSVATVARVARVSPRCASTHLGTLESLGVLFRVRSGGLGRALERVTNKYIVMWSTFRRVLGVSPRWPRRRSDPSASRGFYAGQTPWFNRSGVARGVSRRTRIAVEKARISQVARAVCIVTTLKEQRRALFERRPMVERLLGDAARAAMADEKDRARLFAEALRAESARKKGDPFGSPPLLNPHASPPPCPA